MKRFALGFMLLAVIGVLRAGAIDPAACQVLPWGEDGRPMGIPVRPEHSSMVDVQVFVADSGGIPVPNAYVEIVLNAACLVQGGPHQGESTFCICESAILTEYTNEDGWAFLNFAVGGCCEMEAALVIKADGILIRTYEIVTSPDFDGVMGDCRMGLEDLTIFGNAWAGADPGCTDYDGDDTTDIIDFTMFGSSWLEWCAPR